MTLSHVGTSHVSGQVARRNNHSQHSIGDTVNLKVVRRLHDRNYLVSFRDAQRVVNSTVALTVGSTVRATVTAVGDKLELRYVGADAVAEAMQTHEAVSEDSLAEFAARHAVELREEHRETIEQAMLSAADPTAMASGGIFLSKLSLPLEATNLQAVYAAQTWARASSPWVAAARIDELLQGSADRRQTLATLLDTALGADAAQPDAESPGNESLPATGSSLMPTQAGGSDAQAGQDDWRKLARELLNEQDESSVAYRYGVLPVLIADELVELDLVHFRERRQDERSADARRLIMTFKTSTLGRVEILVRALDDRLSIGVKTDSAASRETLAAHSGEIVELLQRLGWNVELTSYEVGAPAHRAARHLLDHVLSADTLSRLV